MNSSGIAAILRRFGPCIFPARCPPSASKSGRFRRCRFFAALLFLAAVGGWTAEARATTYVWVPTASGTYSWDTVSNWSPTPGAFPFTTADTATISNDTQGDQTINLPVGGETVNKITFGDSNTATAGGWLISGSSLALGGTTPTITVNALGTGKVAEINSNLNMTGTLVSAGAGTLVLSGSSSSIASINVNSQVNFTGTSTATGGVWAISAASNGILNTSGTFSATRLQVQGGTPGAGTVRQTAGQTTLTSVSNSAGARALEVGGNTGKVGYYVLLGGTLNFPSGNSNIAALGDNGLGIVDVAGASVTGGQWILGDANGGTGVMSITSGTVTPSSMVVGSAGFANSFGTLTVGGTGTLNMGTGTLTLSGGASGSTGIATVNLVGGTLQAGAIAKSGGASETEKLTFSGGKIQATASTTTFLQGLTSATIYTGGATIDTNGKSDTILQALLGTGPGPNNNGVSSITLAGGNAGSNYITPPTVTISGGSGSGATAVAMLDANGSIARILVTNPGTGYTSSPTVTINAAAGNQGVLGTGGTAGSGTGATVGTADNTLGGLTLNDSANIPGTLTLSGTNTYTGASTIVKGTLKLANTGSISNSKTIVVGTTPGSGAEFDVTAFSPFSLASGQTLKGSGTVLGNVTIVSGSFLSPGNSPGTLTDTGSETWNGGGNYTFEINKALGTAGSDPGWDWLSISGSLTLNNTSGSPFNVLLTSLTNPGDVAGPVSDFNGAINYDWLFVTAGSAITTFTGSNKFAVNTSAFSNAFTGSFKVVRGDNFGGGNVVDGNADQLYVEYDAPSVPEPSTFALAALGLVGLGCVAWRKKHRRACRSAAV